MLVIKQTQTIVAQVLSRNNSVYLRTLQFMGAINKYNLVKNKATKITKLFSAYLAQIAVFFSTIVRNNTVTLSEFNFSSWFNTFTLD